jgi:hypothetical protein
MKAKRNKSKIKKNLKKLRKEKKQEEGTMIKIVSCMTTVRVCNHQFSLVVLT